MGSELAYETLLFVAGALIGFSLNPFATVSHAPVAGALGVALLSLRVVHALLEERVGSRFLSWVVSGACSVIGFAGVYSVTTFALRDHVPPLHYSLKLLTTDEAVPFRNALPWQDDADFYRFRVMSPGDVDITDLHVALDLPAFLVAEPIILSQAFADDVHVKSAFIVLTNTSPQSGTTAIPIFSNIVIIDATRLLPGAQIEVAAIAKRHSGSELAMATAPDGSIVLVGWPHYGRYGSVSARRRHLHYGQVVNDMVDSFPIAAPMTGNELIIMSSPLRPWSRSALYPRLTEEPGVSVKVEIGFD